MIALSTESRYCAVSFLPLVPVLPHVTLSEARCLTALSVLDARASALCAARVKHACFPDAVRTRALVTFAPGTDSEGHQDGHRRFSTQHGA